MGKEVKLRRFSNISLLTSLAYPVVWISFCRYDKEGIVRAKTVDWNFHVYTDSFFPLDFFSPLDFDNFKLYFSMKSRCLVVLKGWLSTVTIQVTVTVYMEVTPHKERGEKKKAWSIYKYWNQGKFLDKTDVFYCVFAFVKRQVFREYLNSTNKVLSLVQLIEKKAGSCFESSPGRT